MRVGLTTQRPYSIELHPRQPVMLGPRCAIVGSRQVAAALTRGRGKSPTPRICSAIETSMSSSLNIARRWDVARWAPIPLRLIVGYGFIAHGYAKLVKDPDVFVGILHAIGIAAPHVMAWLTILVELMGGLAVLLGAFVPLVSVPMAAVLLVAIFTVHLPYGFTSIKLMAVTAAGPQFGPPGYETDLLYLACLAALVVGGSGPFAVDRAIANRWPITNRSQDWISARIHPVVLCSRRCRSPAQWKHTRPK